MTPQGSRRTTGVGLVAEALRAAFGVGFHVRVFPDHSAALADGEPRRRHSMTSRPPASRAQRAPTLLVWPSAENGSRTESRSTPG